jgi:hypothetical protein
MGSGLAHLYCAPEFFEARYLPGGEAESFACQAVDQLVLETIRRGVSRREYSLASKVLH